MKAEQASCIFLFLGGVMINLRNAAWLWLSVGILMGSAAFAGVKTVTLLDRGEPFEALTVHDGYLWVGKSRRQFNSDYRVEAFRKDGTKVGEAILNHSVTYMYSYGAKSVMALGTGHTPNLTMFTILDVRNGRVEARTRQVPIEAWATRWLGTINGREFFTDPGGNSNDPEAGTNPGMAAQTIFSLGTTSPRYLPTRVRMPLEGLVMNNRIFAIQKDSMVGPHSNLVEIDPSSGQAKYHFQAKRMNLSGIYRLPGSSVVALTERDAHQVVLHDITTGKTLSTLPVDDEPRAITGFGKCIMVGSFEQRGVQVIDVSNPAEPKEALRLEMDLSVNEFAKLFRVGVDATTGQVFGRSNLACNPMMSQCANDDNRVVVWADEAEAVLAACK